VLVAQTRCELLLRWRVPAFSATSLILPVVLFTFFGLPLAQRTHADGTSVGATMLAAFGAYAVGSVMVYAFGVGVAVERALRVDVLVRATPLPPLVHLAAKVLTALAFALAALVLLIVYGLLAGGIQVPAGTWIAVVLRLLAGSTPFIGLGLAIGYTAGPNAAPAVANLVYLPLAFAGGLFVPLDQLPAFVQRLAPWLPTYHYAQLAWSAVGRPAEPMATSLAWLLGYTLLFLALAGRAYRREERLKFA
jgi:ABC-2 type transport system permease protein